jgi:hypothetical protein
VERPGSKWSDLQAAGSQSEAAIAASAASAAKLNVCLNETTIAAKPILRTHKATTAAKLHIRTNKATTAAKLNIRTSEATVIFSTSECVIRFSHFSWSNLGAITTSVVHYGRTTDSV